MKVLAVSDTVLDYLYAPDVHQRFADIELLIGCGDLPFDYLEFLISALDVPMIYVRGNHDQYDRALFPIEEYVAGGQNLHCRVVWINGLLAAGLEGSRRYRQGEPLMYSEGEMSLQLARLLPKLLTQLIQHRRRLDLMISHSPPFGIHDGQDWAHTGFKVFLMAMRYFRPRYWLHGHVQSYGVNSHWQTKVGETMVVNVLPCRQLTL